MSNNPLVSVPTIDEMLAAINETRARFDTDEEFRESLINPNPSGNPISLGRRIPAPEELAELQVKGVRDNADKWLKRVTHPKKNFKEEALKKESVDRFKDSMEKVLSEGRWQGGMALVNESEAMATIEALGSGHYTKAVEARKPKILRVAKELDPDRLSLAATIDGLAKATDSDREAKMIANKRGLQAIGKKRRGG